MSENIVPIEPQVQLFNRETNQEIKPFEDGVENATVIDYGEVKAGDESKHNKLIIWNNKGGEQVASTMRNVELFVVDASKGKNSELVKEGWLHAKCDSGGDVAFTRLNASTNIPLTAKDLEEGTIEGGVNDGEEGTSAKNFATVETYIQIIDNVLNATHGLKNFFTGLRYYFT